MHLIPLGSDARHPRVVHVQHPIQIELSVVHVGRGTPQVAQGGRAELAHVRGVLGVHIAAQVLQFAAVVGQAYIVELIVAEERAVVAVDAAGFGAEEVQAAQLGVQLGLHAGHGKYVLSAQ